MRKQASKTVRVPKGYEQVSTSNFNPLWNFSADPVCEGVVTAIREGTVGKGKDAKRCRYLDLQTRRGVASIRESKNLSAFFDRIGGGEEVLVHFRGTKKIAGRPQPMKVFECFIRGGKRKRAAARG